LSQRVYIMTVRPGRIKQILGLPHPRGLELLTSPMLAEMKCAVLESIKEEGLKAITMLGDA
jgi:hypothetical protein